MKIVDLIHGTICIPSDIANIIGTPIFQRLRKIRQLGFLFALSSNANLSHTRYSHCIGTYWHAKMMLDQLEKNSEWITHDRGWPNVYRPAIEIAALLHDIGHGPFSHTWEYTCDGYNHEQNALPCVDAVFEQLPKKFMPLREDNNFGIELIKSLILGALNRPLPRPLPKEYNFIFEIVSNKQCNLDVDKWDYLKRDHYFLKYMCDPNMDFDDAFLMARVAHDGAHIEYRYRDYDKIYALFEARWKFHCKCYRMSKNLFHDQVLRQILQRRADDDVICNKRLKEINAHDMDAFLQLTDEKVLELIQDDDEFCCLHEAVEINPEDCREQKNIVKVSTQIKGPGLEMPPDQNFHFYGDIQDKRKVNRNCKTTEFVAYFLIT